MLLTPALVAAAVAITLVVCGYMRPHIASTELLNLVGLARCVSFGSSGFTVLVGLAVGVTQWLRRRTVLRRKPFPWYLQACQVIALIAFCVIFLSASNEIKWEADKWMMGGGRGYHWREVSEPMAVACLWGNLRAYAATLLFITMLWIISGGMLVLDRVWTVPVNDQTNAEKKAEENRIKHGAIDPKTKPASSPTILWQGKMVCVRARLVPYLLWTSSSIEVFFGDQRLLHTIGKRKLTKAFIEGGLEHQIELNRERSRNFRTSYQLRIDGVIIDDSHVAVENRFMMMIPITIIVASFFVIFNYYCNKLKQGG